MSFLMRCRSDAEVIETQAAEAAWTPAQRSRTASTLAGKERRENIIPAPTRMLARSRSRGQSGFADPLQLGLETPAGTELPQCTVSAAKGLQCRRNTPSTARSSAG